MNKECLRCGNRWVSNLERPKYCPHCKSPVWDRAKVSGSEASKAHSLVAAAIRNGVLVPQPCRICGKKAIAHHEDYSKPLEVDWLCHKHHRERHAELGGALMDGGLSLRLPDELHVRLKSEAALRGVTLREFCEEILKAGLLRVSMGVSSAAGNDGKGASIGRGHEASRVVRNAKGTRSENQGSRPDRSAPRIDRVPDVSGNGPDTASNPPAIQEPLEDDLEPNAEAIDDPEPDESWTDSDWTCPKCGSHKMKIDGGKTVCAGCGRKVTPSN